MLAIQEAIYMFPSASSQACLYRVGIRVCRRGYGRRSRLICAKAGLDIIRESAETLIDKSQVDASEILQIAECVTGVVECHNIRTRGTKDSIFVDMHCLVNPELSVEKGAWNRPCSRTENKTEIPE